MNTESAAVRKLSDDGEFFGGQRRKSSQFNDRQGGKHRMVYLIAAHMWVVCFILILNDITFEFYDITAQSTC